MHEREINIPTKAGNMPTFTCHPTEDGPHPAVVIYMDVWGLREELLDIARRVATVGYYVLLPDLYYRDGRVRNQYRDENGRMISFLKLTEAQRAVVLAPHNKLTDNMVVEDTGAILDFIGRGEPVRPGPVGSIGYCMGGRHVFRVAAAFPDRFRASACLHGTSLVTDAPDSPHLDARRAKGELYCGHGERDHYSEPENIRAIDEALKGTGVACRQEIHKGIDHGYALPDRDIHDKPAANRDWELIFAMFRRQLGR